MIRKFIITGLCMLVVALGIRHSMMGSMSVDRSLGTQGILLANASPSYTPPCDHEKGDCCENDTCAVFCASLAAKAADHPFCIGWQEKTVTDFDLSDQMFLEHNYFPPKPPPRQSILV